MASLFFNMVAAIDFTIQYSTARSVILAPFSYLSIIFVLFNSHHVILPLAYFHSSMSLWCHCKFLKAKIPVEHMRMLLLKLWWDNWQQYGGRGRSLCLQPCVQIFKYQIFFDFQDVQVLNLHQTWLVTNSNKGYFDLRSDCFSYYTYSKTFTIMGVAFQTTLLYYFGVYFLTSTHNNAGYSPQQEYQVSRLGRWGVRMWHMEQPTQRTRCQRTQHLPTHNWRTSGWWVLNHCKLCHIKYFLYLSM